MILTRWLAVPLLFRMFQEHIENGSATSVWDDCLTAQFPTWSCSSTRTWRVVGVHARVDSYAKTTSQPNPTIAIHNWNPPSPPQTFTDGEAHSVATRQKNASNLQHIVKQWWVDDSYTVVWPVRSPTNQLLKLDAKWKQNIFKLTFFLSLPRKDGWQLVDNLLKKTTPEPKSNVLEVSSLTSSVQLTFIQVNNAQLTYVRLTGMFVTLTSLTLPEVSRKESSCK